MERYSIQKKDLFNYLSEFLNLEYLDMNTPLDRVIPSKYVLDVREKFWSSCIPSTDFKVVGKIDLSVFHPRTPKKRERIKRAPRRKEVQSQESRPLSQKEKEIERLMLFFRSGA